MADSKFGIYKNVTPWPALVKLPAKDVASIPPGKTAVFADAWPGVREAVEAGKIVRIGDAVEEPFVIPER